LVEREGLWFRVLADHNEVERGQLRERERAESIFLVEGDCENSA
jgi:hypothetical protein